MRSAYLALMRSASALRFSKGCSSLNLERILTDFAVMVDESCSCSFRRCLGLSWDAGGDEGNGWRVLSTDQAPAGMRR